MSQRWVNVVILTGRFGNRRLYCRIMRPIFIRLGLSFIGIGFLLSAYQALWSYPFLRAYFKQHGFVNFVVISFLLLALIVKWKISGKLANRSKKNGVKKGSRKRFVASSKKQKGVSRKGSGKGSEKTHRDSVR